MTTNFIGARVPLVDPNTGIATPIFYRLMQGLFEINGVAASTNTDAFEIAPPDQALVAQATALAVAGTENNVTPSNDGLQAEVAILRAAVDDLKKGLVTL